MNQSGETDILLPCPGCQGPATLGRGIDPPAGEYSEYSHFFYSISCITCGTEFRRESDHAWVSEPEQENFQDEAARALLVRTWNTMLYRTPAIDKLEVPAGTPSDVVERLLAGAGGGSHWMALHREAAETITSLREQVDLLDGSLRITYDSEPFAAQLPPWATGEANGKYREIGAVLATRDGRKVGNAIVVKKLPEHSERMKEDVFLVVTDAGNNMLATEREMHDLFHPPRWVSRIWDHPGVTKYYSQRRDLEYQNVLAAIRGNRVVSTLGKDVKEGDVIQGYYHSSAGVFPAAQVLRVLPSTDPGYRELKVAYIAGPGGKVMHPFPPLVIGNLSAYPVLSCDGVLL